MAWRGRRWQTSVPLLGAFGAALVFIASLATTSQQLAHQAMLEAAGHRIGFWESSQALLEAVRLGTQIERLESRDPTSAAEAAETALLRVEILWSRLLALQGGDGMGPTYEALDIERARLPYLFARLSAIEAALVALAGGDPGALERARAVLTEVIELLGDGNRALYQDRALHAETTAAGLGALQRSFAFSALGLILSATLLSALLFWQWRRAKGLLAEAEAARSRAGQSERLLRVVVDSLPAMVSAHDRQGRFLLANAALGAFHRTSEAALIGQDVTAATGAAEDAADLAAALASGAQLPFREASLSGPDGSERVVLTTAAPVAEAGGEASSVVRICLDITERKMAEEQIRYLAEHDSLTGLANRHLFTLRLDRALAERGMVALHLIDLDDFKDVNDSLGHAAGDALLLAAVSRMRACLAPGDLLARLGGDEFAVLHTGLEAPASADAAAARLVQALRAPYTIDGMTVRAGASIGIAIGPTDGPDGPALLQRADIALYQAKAGGRGQARRFSAAMATAVHEQQRLEADVREAMATRAFHFAYQPKFRLSDFAFAGCEALMRWQHPTRGVVPPSVFIPAAERAGVALALAEFTIEAVLRQQAAWRREGFDIPVALNISARHIVSGEAPAMLRRALEAEQGRAERLEIEVTEDVFIRDPDSAADVLQGLRATGVRLALDDFGTGYASLGYLRQLPFDVIKLDRSFVAGLGTDTRTERIVDAVARIAHGLGASLVAEGVESAIQLERLRQIGCDVGQGYLLGRPMTPDALARLVRADSAGTAAAMQAFA